MRRKEREVSSIDEIKDIVESCHVLRLGLFDEKYPYIVPVNYGYQWLKDRLILYIHGAKVGKKVDCIRQNPNVCIEMDDNHQLISGDRIAAKYSYAYRSFIGFGRAEILEDIDEKRQGLKLLMWHEIQNADYDEIPEKMVEKTGMIKIIIEAYSGKYHSYPIEK